VLRPILTVLPLIALSLSALSRLTKTLLMMYMARRAPAADMVQLAESFAGWFGPRARRSPLAAVTRRPSGENRPYTLPPS